MLLPVIDLLRGQVVRGIAGNRSEYRPIQSRLTNEPTPSSVARAFVARFQASDAYVADLDAIGGAEPDWKALDEIGDAGLGIWLDCGVSSVSRAQQVIEFGKRTRHLAAVVVGLESTSCPTELAAVFNTIGPTLAVFSLDLRDGRPLTDAPVWQGLTPLETARVAHDIGFRRQIVLDLASVGVNRGPTVGPLCRELRSMFERMELTAGGGVRDLDDVALLAAAGCNRVLVASALHNGVMPAVSKSNH